jgi:hypothetical protein
MARAKPLLGINLRAVAGAKRVFDGANNALQLLGFVGKRSECPVIENRGPNSMADNKNQAFTSLIKVMQKDAMELMDLIDLAAGDMIEGRRNGAIGALAPADELLERLAAMTVAIRAVHRALPL